jgi:hypothetical protein
MNNFNAKTKKKSRNGKIKKKLTKKEKKMADNTINLRDRFDSISLMLGTTKNAEEKLKEYHFKELFDPDKEYQKEKFYADYGHGRNLYKFKCKRFWEECRKDKEKVKEGDIECELKTYVVAHEILESEELKSLQKYCPCGRCSLWRKNPILFFLCCCFHSGCPCCSGGCLYSPFQHQWLINEARKARKMARKKSE